MNKSYDSLMRMRSKLKTMKIYFGEGDYLERQTLCLLYYNNNITRSEYVQLCQYFQS
jgi:hypothetical protein